MKNAYKRNKRAPVRPPTTETDIYVSRNTIVPAQINRIHSLLEKGHPKVFIHGLGIAVNKAVEVALRFKELYPTVEWEITTNTETLFDDLEPIELDDDSQVTTRNNSAIHIAMSIPK